MEKMIIWQDRNNRILWEKGTISNYTRAIFGKSWILAHTMKTNVSLDEARQIKKQIKSALKI